MAETTIGKRVYLNFERPDKELVKQFAGIPSSNICDMMNRLYCTDGTIKPLNKAPLLGTAFTVKCPAGDNMAMHRAMDLIEPGDILVVDGQGSMERSLAGEIMVRYCMSRGVAGIVVQGCMRDLDAIQGLDFPVYCKGITPQGPFKFGPGEINVPVCVGGQVVLPGDILVGDQDGIVVIRKEDAPAVLAAAKDKYATESKTMQNYEEGIVNYAKHENTYSSKMEKDGFVYYESV